MPRCVLRALPFVLLLVSCGQSPTPAPQVCLPEELPVDTATVRDDAPFRFPLDNWAPDGPFQEHRNFGIYEDKYHSAEDCTAEPGTPVYATASGRISFSGPMDGYGWLIVIDHPQHDLYSLYGHLSSRRWRKEWGRVEEGELVAYIGDSDENGSSPEYGQMHPHLHFGLRKGQRIDYPRSGDTRWMAGWIHACPESIGWLAPSRFIDEFTGKLDTHLSQSLRCQCPVPPPPEWPPIPPGPLAPEAPVHAR